MSQRSRRTEQEIQEMERLIDKGILLAQRRLVERTKRDEDTLVVYVGGRIVDMPAKDIHFPK